MDDFIVSGPAKTGFHVSVEHLSPLSTWVNTIQMNDSDPPDYKVQEMLSQHLRIKVELVWSELPPFTYVRKVLYEAELIPVIANSLLSRDVSDESWMERISRVKRENYQIYPIVIDNYTKKLLKYEKEFDFLVARNLLLATREPISDNGSPDDDVHILFSVAPHSIIDVEEETILRMIKHEREKEQELFQTIPTLN